MEVAAKRYQSEIERIKTNVRRAHDYFKPNYDRFNEFRRFIFDTSIRDEDITLLQTLSRPQLEFNILEAYISRLLGEFSKQEPDIEVSADDQNSADPTTIKVLEQHLRHTLTDSDNKHNKYEVYKDLLSGGFSGLKVFTEYAHEMSFDQVIRIDRVYDPTLIGFDQLARYSHKGDGRFCFELFPMSEEEFHNLYPDIKLDRLSFRRDFGGFNWSYREGTEKILIVADYYEKKEKQIDIVMLAGEEKKVIPYDEYKKMLDEWGEFQAPPAIVGGKPRKTTIVTIERYRCMETLVLEHKKTDYKKLPIIFVDGNSVMVQTPKNGNVRQLTRPYTYHAKDAQRLKNYAGITLANEIENTIQHKFMVAKEALPKEEELLQAYKDVQKASVLVYNSVHEEDPDKPISSPIAPIVRSNAPAEIVQAFTGADSLIQNILGSYDAALGINNNQLSGIAIVEAATQSNATAMPYIIGYLDGYQRAAELYVDLFPKYYKTPRTIPIKDAKGQKSYVLINQDQGVNMYYDANALNVIVKAGASFQVQKSRTLMMVKEMMGMSQLFAQFISERGLPFVLDQMEGHGIEELKKMVDGWLQELQQQKQMAMQQQQQQMQNNPAALKQQVDMAKLQQEGQKNQQQFAVDMAKLKSAEQKVLADIEMDKRDSLVQALKANTERFAKQVELQIAHKDISAKHHLAATDMHHRHRMDVHHALRESHKDMRERS